uniref:ATPase AAA-type core domain-containing protein n=1 Tax=Parascaris equorum TaxID=6256 RepID=A0A914RAH6_PAREQ
MKKEEGFLSIIITHSLVQYINEHAVNFSFQWSHRSVKQLIQEAIEPYVVLIAGERAANFSADIVNVFLNVTNRGAMERIILDGQKKRYELDKEIMRSLSKGSKTVILDGVDKLRGDTPLSLHSVCDPDHSPFSSALILLTINRPLRAVDSQCEIAVSSVEASFKC